jgi:hypothetical protein
MAHFTLNTYVKTQVSGVRTRTHILGDSIQPKTTVITKTHAGGAVLGPMVVFTASRMLALVQAQEDTDGKSACYLPRNFLTGNSIFQVGVYVTSEKRVMGSPA